jgi:predicted molibdopterin-dependent oxidoreductase YjgC
LKEIASGIANGTIRTLIVFGEDVTRFGISAELLGKVETLVVSDILPNATTKLAHVLLPGCAHAEKRGTFVNAKGRVQRFLKAVEPPGNARPEAEFLEELLALLAGSEAAHGNVFSMEALFNRMAREIPALSGIEWAKLGDGGAPAAV